MSSGTPAPGRFVKADVEPRRHRLDDGVLPVVRLAMGEASFVSHALSACSDRGWPGIDVGQNRDCRYSTDDTDGVHTQTFEQHGNVEIHLDRKDVCRRRVGHAADDTALVPGLVVVGGLAGIVLAAIAFLTGQRTRALAILLGGLALGGVLGGHIPRRSRFVTSLVDLGLMVVV